MGVWYPLFFLLTALFLFYKYVNRLHGYWKKKGVFHLEPLPFIGNMKDIVLQKISPVEFMRDIYSKGKGHPYMGLYTFGTPTLVLRSPKVIKDVLQKDFAYFDSRTVTVPNHDKMTRSMLFMSKNPTWKTMRQKMTPAYTSGKLKSMYPVVSEVGEAMVQYLYKNYKKECLDARDLAGKYSVELISRTTFAINAGCFDSEECEFRKWVARAFDPRFVDQIVLFFAPSLVNVLKPEFVESGAKKFFGNIFGESMKMREKNSSFGKDLTDILVQLKKNDDSGLWNDEAMLGQAIQVFFAGSETTTQSISYTLYELALQPEIQERLRNELKQMVEENNGKIDYETLLNLKYLGMCVNETMRRYPALPFLDRLCNKDYKVESTGLVIEKGTKVYVPVLGLSYDEEFYKDPERYDPERFSDMSVINKDGLYYLPFGEGPRVCIGARFGQMNVKIALASVLLNFRVSPSKETPVPLELLKNQFFIIPKAGLPLKFDVL